jgi:hypothetical protein
VDARASGAHREIAGQADKAFERSTGAQTNDANADGEVVWSWHPLQKKIGVRANKIQPTCGRHEHPQWLNCKTQI